MGVEISLYVSTAHCKLNFTTNNLQYKYNCKKNKLKQLQTITTNRTLLLNVRVVYKTFTFVFFVCISLYFILYGSVKHYNVSPTVLLMLAYM